MSDKEKFLLAMRLLDSVLDGIVHSSDLGRITGLDMHSCDAILNDYYKLSAQRNAT